MLEKSFGPSLEAVLALYPAPTTTAAAAAGKAAQAAGTPPPQSISSGSSSTSPVPGSSSSGSANQGGGVAAAAAGVTVPAGPSSAVAAAKVCHPLVMLNRQAFTLAAEKHLEHLVLQLLRAEEVPDAATWAPVLSSLAQEAASSLMSAAAAAHGEQDPRYYIKVGRRLAAGREVAPCEAL